MFIKSLNIIIIDDDSLIRSSIKLLINNISIESKLGVKMYSSSDGVDGLGLVYVANPDLIIIDSTLPRYSGREIIDYLIKNDKYRNKSIIILNDDVHKLSNLPANYRVISKSNSDFVAKLSDAINDFFQRNHSGFEVGEDGIRVKFTKSLISSLIPLANRGDLLMYRISNLKNILIKFFLYIPWIVLQLLSSLVYSIMLLVYREVKDANISQGEKDLVMFRVRTYPTLVTLIVALIFIILQVALLLGGGIILFNSVKVQSVFADYSKEVRLDLSQASYNPEEVEISEGKIKLKPITQVIEQTPIPQLEESITVDEEESAPLPQELEESIPQINEVQDVEEIEEVDLQTEEIISEPTVEDQVLGVSTILTYPSVAEVRLNVPTEFSTLKSILEESSNNLLKDSTIDLTAIDGKRRAKTNVEVANRILPTVGISYQLSPDNQTWYYYSGGEGKWELTTVGVSSSNTIQEVNNFLNAYIENIGGNQIFLKVFLSSDTNFQTELQSIVIVREIYTITQIVEPNSDEINQSNVDQGNQIVDIDELDRLILPPLSTPLSYVDELVEVDTNDIPQGILPSPVIFQAPSVNGNKIVYGKVLSYIDLNNLSRFKVRAYFSLGADEKTTVLGDYIGESSLEINPSGEITFLINTPGVVGGNVVVELVYVSENGSELRSELSDPVQS